MKSNKFLNVTARGAGGVLGVVFGLGMMALNLFMTGAFIVGAVYVFRAVTNHFHHTTKTNTSISTPAEYVSTTNSFEIAFPYGQPTVQTQNENIQGVSVPYTYYYTSANNDNVQYILTFYSLPAQQLNLSSERKANIENLLQGEMNDYAQTQKVSVTSSSFTSFQGNTAIQAHLGNTSQNSLTEAYYLGFTEGNNNIVIQVWGTTQNNYLKFINSFKLINQ